MITTTLEGEPVAGALELSPLAGVLVWRLEAARVPGATDKLGGSVTNPSSPEGTLCAQEVLSIAVAPAERARHRLPMTRGPEGRGRAARGPWLTRPARLTNVAAMVRPEPEQGCS